MSEFDYGPLKSYEITWANGHAETVQAHQVTMPLPELSGLMFRSDTATKMHDFIKFHEQIDGRWCLVLAVKPELVHVIRDKATEEAL